MFRSLSGGRTADIQKRFGTLARLNGQYKTDMKNIQLGIIREGKTPPDKRVPLTPEQCVEVQEKFPHVKVFVQPSPIRAFKDEEYAAAGIELQEDLSHCDILMGVKEVPVDMLIPGKTYLFFSHTWKKQSYNRELLRTILEKKIRLVDYELLQASTPDKKRLIGFGRFAGLVGCYNGFRGYGQKHGYYTLKPAHECEDLEELNQELRKVSLPNNFRLVITGGGRVAGGAIEILEELRFRKLSPEEYLNGDAYPEPVYCQLQAKDYYRKPDHSEFEKSELYQHPERFESDFLKYAKNTDMYVPTHFWNSKAPFIFTREDARSEDFDIDIIADISCDIDGPVASTLRPSTIEDPFYGYDPQTEKETALETKGSIGVMAVDNLPCELPKDASKSFGNELIFSVFPHLFGDDKEGIIANASETTPEGRLTDKFSYLQDYVDGK